MKKFLLLGLIALVGLVNAQEESSKDFNQWQIRLRALVVTPNAGDNIDAGDVAISTAVVPELDFTYFFTENWAAELILGTAKHTVDLETAAGDSELGKVWLLPPTLTAQYHINTGSALRPYVGAGINYTIFYGVDKGDGGVELEYDNSFGFAGQVGVDYDLNEKWFLNADLKYVGINTDVSVAGEKIAEVDINPLLIGVGVGMKF